MRRLAIALLVCAAAAALAACGLEPKPRVLPAGFAHPRFMLISDEAQGPLLVGGDYGLQYSVDGGRTWQLPATGRKPAVAAAPYYDRILVSRGATAQVYDYSLEGDANPRVAWPFGAPVTLLAGNARKLRLWALSTDGGLQLHYSNDGGTYWWDLPAVGLCAHPRALAVGGARPKKTERLWVACGRQGLQASDDLGASFQYVPGVSNAQTVAAARSVAGRIAVATPKVIVTRDNGRTWSISGLNATAIAIDPRNPDLVFAAGSDGRLFASLDGGRSF
ncbi:MAG: WD40/YVTN/BNR-like repeat-containing protein [Gaiellales bacterium]